MKIQSRKGMAVAGIVLSAICLMLIIINGAMGAYQGQRGEACFQKNHKDHIGTHENIEESVENNVFTLRDGDGNILMTGGIESARMIQDSYSIDATSYIVEIQFTDSASDTFYQITSEHIGESIGIYINDEMISNPAVQCAISEGSVLIYMDSLEDAEQLAALLRSTVSAQEPASAQEQEEVIDNTQANTERFYQAAEEEYGLSREQAQSWFNTVMEDDIFDGGVREISDLVFDDIDGNGKGDMVIMVQETNMKNMYGTGALYFYMNQEEPYCFADEDFPYFGYMDICYADWNGDGNVEIAFALPGTGNGGTGDWHMAVLSCTGSAMEHLEIPSDLAYDNAETGIKVNVMMEPEPDTYTAYCPYFDESITFQASNAREGDAQKEYLAQAPMEVGGNCRGFFDLQAVVWEGRNALQVHEYLYGEGGIVHSVGSACFVLVWDERGNGSVADWWVN